MTSWNEILRDELKQGEVVIAKAPADEAVWDAQFYDGYGGTEGAPVLAWSVTRVFFPVCYDGSEWLASAPRDPQPEGQEHVGGG